MATGPKPARTPQEVLAIDAEPRENPWLKQFYGPAVGGLTGLMCVTFGLWAAKRPFLSGLQAYAIWVGGGAALGKYVDDYRDKYFAERDAMFRHYMELHPEDFPPFPRQKYADLLEPWVPIR